jgi:IS1 family transposase
MFSVFVDHWAPTQVKSSEVPKCVDKKKLKNHQKNSLNCRPILERHTKAKIKNTQFTFHWQLLLLIA